jgi:hypothetical protein
VQPGSFPTAEASGKTEIQLGSVATPARCSRAGVNGHPSLDVHQGLSRGIPSALDTDPKLSVVSCPAAAMPKDQRKHCT